MLDRWEKLRKDFYSVKTQRLVSRVSPLIATNRFIFLKSTALILSISLILSLSNSLSPSLSLTLSLSIYLSLSLSLDLI
jgi:hypothetical protein